MKQPDETEATASFSFDDTPLARELADLSARRRALESAEVQLTGRTRILTVSNQKGGVGKTTTAVNLTACVAAAGSQTLLVDLDPQCNATVALGGDRDAHPSSYDCLIGEVSVAEAARPAGPDNLWLVAANRDLAGAAVELPRLEGSETRLRERLGPVR